MKKVLSALLSVVGVVAGAGIANANPPVFSLNCSDPAWIGEPGKNERGMFEATVTSTCKIKLQGSSGSISVLNKNLIRGLDDEKHIHTGPYSTNYKNLPGVYYGITSYPADGEDDLEMDKDIHVASDLSRRLVFDMKATRIKGTGNAGHLKGLAYDQEVTATGAADTFSLKVVENIELDVPGAGLFSSIIKKKVASKFMEDVRKDGAGIALNLVQK